jgi:hypothetical protein
MEIGKPKRVHRVEPLTAPVPSKRRPAQAPRRRVRQAPAPVRAK